MAEADVALDYKKGNDLIDTLVNNQLVKVDRREFLFRLFKNHAQVNAIYENGPIGIVEAKQIESIAKRLINQATLRSSVISFAAGIPGGLAAIGTIPADILQFYGTSAVLAQELMYLYSYPDMYHDENLTEDGRQALVAFLGVMLGVSGANTLVRGLSLQLASQAAKKLPQKALTKTVYYPIIKKIIIAFGGKLTKDSFAKSVSKAIPLIGGVISGGITLSTLKPMGIKLQTTLHEATFAVDEPQGASAKLKEAKELFDLGILNAEEFAAIKNKYVAQL